VQAIRTRSRRAQARGDSRLHDGAAEIGDAETVGEHDARLGSSPCRAPRKSHEDTGQDTGDEICREAGGEEARALIAHSSARTSRRRFGLLALAAEATSALGGLRLEGRRDHHFGARVEREVVLRRHLVVGETATSLRRRL